jgi:hypothetical protein
MGWERSGERLLQMNHRLFNNAIPTVRIHLDRSQIAKELNTTPVLEKKRGLQEKMDTTCKSNAT